MSGGGQGQGELKHQGLFAALKLDIEPVRGDRDSMADSESSEEKKEGSIYVSPVTNMVYN